MATDVNAVYYSKAIQDLRSTIFEKCNLLGETLDKTREKFHHAEETAYEVVFQHTPLVQDMDNVFEKLRSIDVDPNMIVGEKNKTLYDYIDAETVQSLQQDAMEQTNYIKEALEEYRQALDSLNSIYKFFQSFETNLKVESIPNDLDTLMKIYDKNLRIFVDMEQCEKYLLQHFTTINDIYSSYNIMFAEAHTLFDELRTLRDFYQHFLQAYLALGPEMLRRLKYEESMMKMVSDMKQKLQAVEREELESRNVFTQEHAGFLPSTLCPQVRQLPEHYEITPCNVNHLPTPQQLSKPK